MLFRQRSVSRSDRRPSTSTSTGNYGMATHHDILATGTEHSLSAADHSLSTTHHCLHWPIDCLRWSADRICCWRRRYQSSRSSTINKAGLPGQLLFDPGRSWSKSSNHRHWALRNHLDHRWCSEAVIEAWYMDADSVGDCTDSLPVAHCCRYPYDEMPLSHTYILSPWQMLPAR